jgi:hypothetical protein
MVFASHKNSNNIHKTKTDMEKTTAIPLTQPFHIAPPATQTTAAAGVKTATKTSVSTHKTMAKPTAKTNMQILGNVSPPAIRLPTQRSPRKQTALTAFYTIQPLHIIQSNRKAHNSNKRKLQKLSSPLPPFQQNLHTSMSFNPLSPGPGNPTATVQIPVPSDKQMTLIATSCGISTEQLSLALEFFLQFQGYTFPNQITPASGTKRKVNEHNPINIDGDSDTNSAVGHLTYDYMAQGFERKFFTTAFNKGNNKWIPDHILLQVLKEYYNFMPTTLNLCASRDKLTRLVTLASDILNAGLSLTQVNAICDMDNVADPFTRFTATDTPSIMAVDSVKYTSDLQLHNVMFGKNGSLYKSTSGIVPPKNSIIFMQIKGFIPSQEIGTTNIEHAIFLPEQLLLITVNDFEDAKDESGNYRVRNAWQIRNNLYRDITNTEDPSEKIKICNQRVAGRIFGGGGNSQATLLRAAILFKPPTKE